MSNNPASTVRLPMLVNLATNASYTLGNPSIKLGRSPDCKIILEDDEYASGEHARVYYDQGRWLIEDLMSSNGTYVNDALISEPFSLAPGHVIRVGRTQFRIE